MAPESGMMCCTRPWLCDTVLLVVAAFASVAMKNVVKSGRNSSEFCFFKSTIIPACDPGSVMVGISHIFPKKNCAQ